MYGAVIYKGYHSENKAFKMAIVGSIAELMSSLSGHVHDTVSTIAKHSNTSDSSKDMI